MNLSRMPASMIAGDSLRVAIPVGDYPSSAGWAVSLVLQALAGGALVTAEGVEEGGEWLLALTSSASANLAPGPFRYSISASSDGDRQTIDIGQVEVRPNPAKPGADQRSPARRALDAIDAVLEGRAGSEDARFTFADGRELWKVPHPELLSLRTHYARIVAREATKGRGPKRVLVRL